jgi:mono/diheme cytochrome c family protein
MKGSAMLVLLATALGGIAAEAADANHGRTLARRWCATCHVVAANQQRATGEAPPFAGIAKRSDFNATRLANFLLDPHPKMPNMSLTRTEAADIAAYIATLAR